MSFDDFSICKTEYMGDKNDLIISGISRYFLKTRLRTLSNIRKKSYIVKHWAKSIMFQFP